jgi:hypothetical protein
MWRTGASAYRAQSHPREQHTWQPILCIPSIQGPDRCPHPSRPDAATYRDRRLVSAAPDSPICAKCAAGHFIRKSVFAPDTERSSASQPCSPSAIRILAEIAAIPPADPGQQCRSGDCVQKATAQPNVARRRRQRGSRQAKYSACRRSPNPLCTIFFHLASDLSPVVAGLAGPAERSRILGRSCLSVTLASSDEFG